MAWKAIVHSEIGTSHQKLETLCQDFGHYDYISDQDKDVVLGAVADGAGSCTHSDTGSKIAVEEAVSYLKTSCLKMLEKNPQKNWQKFSIKQKEAEDMFEEMLKQIISKLKDEAAKQKVHFKEFSCTLIAFIAAPNCLVAMHIGDGFIVGKFEHKDYELLFLPQKGEYAGETIFITSSQVCKNLSSRTMVLPGKCQFVCASTDGLEKQALMFRPQNNILPYDKFFNYLDNLIKSNSIADAKKGLIHLMSSQVINDGTDDDKTLLVCINQETKIAEAETDNDNPIKEETQPGKTDNDKQTNNDTQKENSTLEEQTIVNGDESG